MNFLSDLTRWLIPAPCWLCGAPTVASDGLCGRCDTVWGRADALGARCRGCAIRVPVADIICPDCQQHPRQFDRAVTGLDFDRAARALIHRYKFQRDTAVLTALLRPLIQQIETNYPQAPAEGHAVDWPQALVPMPIHPVRRRGRGFNQARLIADRLGRRFDVPVLGHVAHRVQASDPQTVLDAAARRRSLRNAFRVQDGLPRHVALIDDVMTTGSTVDSLARAVKRAGVERVTVWVLARTPRPEDRDQLPQS